MRKILIMILLASRLLAVCFSLEIICSAASSVSAECEEWRGRREIWSFLPTCRELSDPIKRKGELQAVYRLASDLGIPRSIRRARRKERQGSRSALAPKLFLPPFLFPKNGAEAWRQEGWGRVKLRTVNLHNTPHHNKRNLFTINFYCEF